MVELLLSHPGHQGKSLGPSSLGNQVGETMRVLKIFKWNSIIRVLLLYSSFENACHVYMFQSFRPDPTHGPTRTSLSIIRPCHQVQIFSALDFYQSFTRAVPSTHKRKEHYQITTRVPKVDREHAYRKYRVALLTFISSSITQFLACCYHTRGNLRLCDLSTPLLSKRRAKDTHLGPSRNHAYSSLSLNPH